MSEDDRRKAMEAMASLVQQLWNDKKFSEMADLYLEEGLMLSTGKPPMGKTEIKEMLGQMSSFGVDRCELKTDDFVMEGSLGVRRGSYKLFSADGTVMDEGKAVETYRWVDGEWKVLWDIFNSNITK